MGKMMVQPERRGRDGKVEILLATFNNEDYLEPLLDSLLRQSHQDFHLLVSDDCSTDRTRDILHRYAPRFRNPPRMVMRDTPSGSAKANFASLMTESRGDAVFLCDADDVWHENKIALFLEALASAEREKGTETPVLLYSDAAMIDGQGHRIEGSYWKYKKIDPQRCSTLPQLMVCPPMLGCASVMNKALVEQAAAVPVDRVTGHDWWAILVASAIGHVGVVYDQTMDYRVHGRNSSRPRAVRLGSLARLGPPVHEVRRRLAIRMRQAEPLIEQFGDRMLPSRREEIRRFIAVSQQSFWARRFTLAAGGYVYPDWRRNLAWMTFC